LDRAEGHSSGEEGKHSAPGYWISLRIAEVNSDRYSQSNTNRPVGIGASGLERSQLSTLPS
jgi:hypothetical protein